MRKPKSGNKTPAKAKAKPEPASGRERMRAYRERMKATGLRPVQHWVPDLRNPKVRERIRREAAQLDEHPETEELNAWLDAVLADADWT
jgi:DNA-binding LacI/PurR family transcriptional regulator